MSQTKRHEGDGICPLAQIGLIEKQYMIYALYLFIYQAKSIGLHRFFVYNITDKEISLVFLWYFKIFVKFRGDIGGHKGSHGGGGRMRATIGSHILLLPIKQIHVEK